MLAAKEAPTTEVVVTLHERPLSALGADVTPARRAAQARRVDAAQAAVARRIVETIPEARVRWRYRVVVNGLAVVVPAGKAGLLARIPGVARTWPNVAYPSAAVRFSADAETNRGPTVIGADKLWGLGLETAGNGIKIGIIDDGVDQAHPFFNPSGYTMPPGFPKGNTSYTTAKHSRPVHRGGGRWHSTACWTARSRARCLAMASSRR